MIGAEMQYQRGIFLLRSGGGRLDSSSQQSTITHQLHFGSMNSRAFCLFLQFPLRGARLHLALIEGINEKGDCEKRQEHDQEVNGDAFSVNFAAKRASGRVCTHAMPADFATDKRGRHFCKTMRVFMGKFNAKRGGRVGGCDFLLLSFGVSGWRENDE